MIGFIKNAWKGEAKLWKVFWLMGLLIAVLTVILMMVLTPLLFISPYAYIGIYIVWTFLAQGFILIADWRCAFNCGWKGWGYIVRTLVVLGAIGTLASLAMTVMSVLAMGQMGGMMQQFEGEMQNFQMEMQQFEQQGGFEGGSLEGGAFDPNAYDPYEDETLGDADADMDAAMQELDQSMKELEALSNELDATMQGMGEGPMAQESLTVTPEMQEVPAGTGGVGAAPAIGAEQADTMPAEEPVATEPAAAATTPAPTGELADACGEKFDQSYRDRGFDPAQYPQQRTDYIKMCTEQVQAGGAQ